MNRNTIIAVAATPKQPGQSSTARLRSTTFFAALLLLLIVPMIIDGAQLRPTTQSIGAQNQLDSAGQKKSADTGATGDAAAGDTAKTDSVDKPKPCDSYAKLAPTVKVTEVYKLQGKGSDKLAEERKAGLNDTIFIKVKNLEPLYELSKCLKQEIGLFLNGRLIKGLNPVGPPKFEEPDKPNPGNKASASDNNASAAGNNASVVKCERPCGLLQYHLDRDAGSDKDRRENHELWADLLGLSSDVNEWSWDRPIEVSVGLAGESPVPTDVTRTQNNPVSQFNILRVRVYRFLGWLVAFVAGVWFFIRLAKDRDLLRDRAPVVWPQRRPYSLSAVQGAWWFILIVFSFIFIWLVTGQQDLSSTALILLSISLGTALGATVIDVNKKASGVSDQTNPAELNQLLSEKQKIEEELEELKRRKKEAEGFAEKKAEYDKKIEEIRQKFPGAIGPAHEGFLLDILSDASGISFHRFQMMVWTVVLGVLFISSVLGRLAMPEFSTTLLALMGISAGTFLGFKIPENNNVPTAPKPPVPPKLQANEPVSGAINPSTQSQGSGATPKQPI